MLNILFVQGAHLEWNGGRGGVNRGEGERYVVEGGSMDKQEEKATSNWHEDLYFLAPYDITTKDNMWLDYKRFCALLGKADQKKSTDEEFGNPVKNPPPTNS